MTTMNDLGERLNALEPVMAAIAGRSVYVVTAAALGLTIGHNCGGFACGGLSRLVQGKLPERFTDDRAAIVLNERQFRQESDFDSDDERYLNAILAHELAHCCDMWPGPLPVYPASAASIAVEVQSQVALTPRDWHGPNLPKWFGHEERFLRALCHVQHRMECIGLPVDSYLAFPDDYYDLDRFECYVENLRCEMASRQGEPISEILKSEPPKLFTELWQVDSGPGRAMLLAAGPSL